MASRESRKSVEATRIRILNVAVSCSRSSVSPKQQKALAATAEVHLTSTNYTSAAAAVSARLCWIGSARHSRHA